MDPRYFSDEAARNFIAHNNASTNRHDLDKETNTCACGATLYSIAISDPCPLHFTPEEIAMIKKLRITNKRRRRPDGSITRSRMSFSESIEYALAQRTSS